MKTNLLEVVMGAVVLIACAVFAAFVYTTSCWRSTEGYEVTAKFQRIDGLRPGSDVRIGGVKVGNIKMIRLDPKTYLAVVHVSLPHHIKLPQDTAAEVASEGLLGGKFLALLPGGEEILIEPGGEIQHTQSSVSLEALIGQFMFNSTQEKK
jgi:phospholipid/cholesterol/gamma-HCH transport system substrate-binding protein